MANKDRVFDDLMWFFHRKQRALAEGDHKMARRCDWATGVIRWNIERRIERRHEAQRAAKATTPTIVGPSRARRTVRSRERRDSSGRSSARSGDSGSDSDSEPPTDLWRWVSERSWRNLVASVQSRDFEHELYLERLHGVAR